MRPFRFRIVALIAAYAVALHTLLTAFAVVMPAGTAHVAELCAGVSAGDSSVPLGGHDAACAMACAMLGGATAPAAVPGVSPAMLAVALVLGPTLGAEAASQRADGPPRARAPPLA